MTWFVSLSCFILVKMLCVSTDGPDSSSPLENKLGGFGQHFQSSSVGRDPTSPPCHQGLDFRVPESPTVAIAQCGVLLGLCHTLTFVVV